MLSMGRQQWPESSRRSRGGNRARQIPGPAPPPGQAMASATSGREVDRNRPARHAARLPSAPAAPGTREPVTDTPEPVDRTDTWEGMLDSLRRRFPGQKDSVLFCVHKLTQNPELTLRDFRAEADLHGIPTAGRALHSARVLLGLQQETPKPTTKAAAAAAAHPRKHRTPEADDGGVSIEAKVLAAVRQIQNSAGAEAEQLRQAIRQAITILQRALG